MPKDTGIGASPKRREDVRFLTGAGNFEPARAFDCAFIITKHKTVILNKPRDRRVLAMAWVVTGDIISELIQSHSSVGRVPKP